MEILIKLAQYHDSKGHLRESDYVDNLILRIAKSEDGEDLIEGVEWKNPNLDPKKLQEMERNIYPEGFHYYTDMDIPSAKGLIEYLPKEQRTLRNVSDSFVILIAPLAGKLFVCGEKHPTVAVQIQQCFVF
jgi:hypothetical protein